MSSSRVRAKKGVKKRAQRATSNVFAMFDQSQIQEFKEAFNMIDQNHDGFICKEDLHDMLASLGMWYQFYFLLLSLIFCWCIYTYVDSCLIIINIGLYSG